MDTTPFSVLISVYQGDDPKHFRSALWSIYKQTLRPREVVVVADGPLTSQLEEVLDEFSSMYPEILRVIRLSENRGLGTALRIGVKKCSHDIVARMDSDDISVPERFEMQLKYLLENPDVDVVGSDTGEFTTSPDAITGIRSVPADREKVRSMARVRSPTNHPSVMFRRQSVLDAGNYSSLRTMQDYELWMRMLSRGYIIENIPEILVKCRAGENLYQRRGGMSYARLEYELQQQFHQMGMLTRVQMVRNILLRVPVRLVPSQVRQYIYTTLLRK